MISCLHANRSNNTHTLCNHFTRWVETSGCSECPFFAQGSPLNPEPPVPVRPQHVSASVTTQHLSPFTSTPARHCIGHLYPVASNQMWLWNIQQLLKRIDLFNGRRIISVALDDTTVSKERVQSALTGYGFEIRFTKNHAKQGEVVSFLWMMKQLGQVLEDPNTVIFYWHGKGVTRKEDVAASVKEWTSAMWETCLDDWTEVSNQLNTKAITGSFLMPWPGDSTYHYSGTFFWIRAAALAGRKWQKIEKNYGGVEKWPGRHFTLGEMGCLFADHTTDKTSVGAFYGQPYWESTGRGLLATWREKTTQSTSSDITGPARANLSDYSKEELHYLTWQLLACPNDLAIGVVRPPEPDDLPLSEAEKMRLIELGGGENGIQGYVNMDRCQSADICHDLDKLPWPLDSDSVTDWYSSNCLEHLSDPHMALREVCRASKLGANVVVRVPDSLSDGAMCWDHKQTLGEIWWRNLFEYLPDSFNANGRTLRIERVERLVDDFWFRKARASRLFQDYTDQELIDWVPRVCGELKIHLVVIKRED